MLTSTATKPEATPSSNLRHIQTADKTIFTQIDHMEEDEKEWAVKWKEKKEGRARLVRELGIPPPHAQKKKPGPRQACNGIKRQEAEPGIGKKTKVQAQS